MFIVASHIRDLIFGRFISETVEEVSSEIGALGSRLGLKKYGSLEGGTYFKSIKADVRYNYKFFYSLKFT